MPRRPVLPAAPPGAPPRLRRLAVAGLCSLTALWAVPAAAPAAAPPDGRPAAAAPASEQVAAQVLTWTAGNSVTDYTSAPSTATAGPATVVFENSTATGNTIGMPHTVTFDTSTPGYNHDVPLNILASPFDATGGRHTAEVVLSPGKYRYFCAIPGHQQMVGEIVVLPGEADTTAPETSAVVTGTQDADGSYVGSATVTVSATDAGSGVAGVEVDLDGTGFRPYASPLVVSTPGRHTVTHRATDATGNTSAAGSVTFTVAAPPPDTTAPTVTATVAGERDAAGAYLGRATVTLAATDDASGIAVVEYDLDGTGFRPYTTPLVVDAVGEHVVAHRATDAAGNTSAVGSVVLTVVAPPQDTTPPTVTATVAGDQDDDGAYVGSATVSLTATDAGSGVASTEYDLDGAGFRAYTGPVVVDAVGQHTLVHRATDAAGNVSTAGSVVFAVAAPADDDETPPVVLAEVTGERDARGAYVGTATVRLTGVDDDSGVASVEYGLHGHWMPYTTPVVLPEGRHVLTYRAVDGSGNTSAIGSLTITVVVAGPADTAAPQTSATVVGTRDANGRYVGRGTVSVTASDEGSGLGSVEYRLDGGTWQGYSAPVVVASEGRHSVSYRATDRKGNVSRTASVVFTVVALRRDACPDSDVRPTVVIGDHDSTVANIDTGDGCTINDLVDEHGDHRNRAALLRHVREVTADLVERRIISPSERSRIVEAARGERPVDEAEQVGDAAAASTRAQRTT